MDAKEYLSILHVAERLKDAERHCTTSNRRTESVAEHCWRTALMALLLKHEFSELDIGKVIEMCLIHDLGECFTGDIPTFKKTDNDRAAEEEKLNDWLNTLPVEIKGSFSALFQEMKMQKTDEARLFNAIDKLEALIQHNESPLDTWSENETELNKTYAFDKVDFSDWLLALRKEILNDTLKKLKESPHDSV